MVQLYAQSYDGEKIFVETASKSVDYCCLECGRTVRLRGGAYRQLHFYHIDEGPKCSQREKTIEHILTQKWLQNMGVGLGISILLEVRFPEINRIADAVWSENRIVFEVQVSPMTCAEGMSRIQDYRKAGFETVFILHTKTYGKRLATPLEEALASYTHYYTDIQETGGSIFDMLCWICRGRRLFLQNPALRRCVIDMASIQKREVCSPSASLEVLKHRERTWMHHAEGDLLFYPLQAPDIAEAMELEKSLFTKEKKADSASARFFMFMQASYRKLIERLCGSNF